jgi:hypothetical protein
MLLWMAAMNIPARTDRQLISAQKSLHLLSLMRR